MKRLRWKLLIAMLAVIIATIAISAAFTRRVTHEQVRRLVILRNDGKKHVLPPIDDTETHEFAILDQRLIVTFAGATAIAVLLTFLMSQRITTPIERLTMAVQDMARGETPAHVSVSGRDEIAQLATSFNSMADAITTQRELRRRMVGDVAHELRTPLTNLRCELEAIQDGLTVADPSRIGSLHEEVLHLQRLVEDLQELAVAEGGGLKLQMERVDLAALIPRVLEPFRSQRSVSYVGPPLRRTGPAGEPALREDPASCSVTGDPMRITQILNNLLTNAAAHAHEIRVAVECDETNAIVTVADNGPGIPPSELEHIFERFYRVDDARARESGGAGLGLAIVRRLVELHGGHVWAESTQGQGATFKFTLPLAG